MQRREFDWKGIASNPRFISLYRKKTRFLLTLWILGAVPYFMLTFGAAYTPEIFNTRLVGRLNVGYLFCVVQFFVTAAIGAYYMYVTNKVFDPLTSELLDDLEPEGRP